MSTRKERRLQAKKMCKQLGGKLKVKGTLKHLENIKNEIPFYPLEKQALYVDGVMKENYNNLFMLQDGIKETKESNDLELYQDYNTTSIGNLAFIILNTNYPSIKKDCEEILERIKSYIEFIGKAPDTNPSDNKAD